MPPSSRHGRSASRSSITSSGSNSQNRTPLPHVLITAPVRVKGHHHRQDESDFSEWSRSPSQSSAMMMANTPTRQNSTALNLNQSNHEDDDINNNSGMSPGGLLMKPSNIMVNRAIPSTAMQSHSSSRRQSLSQSQNPNHQPHHQFARGNSPAATLPQPLQPSELLTQYYSPDHQQSQQQKRETSAFSPHQQQQQKSSPSSRLPPIPLAPSPKLQQQQQRQQQQRANHHDPSSSPSGFHQNQKRTSVTSFLTRSESDNSIVELMDPRSSSTPVSAPSSPSSSMSPQTTKNPLPTIPLKTRLRIFFKYYNQNMIVQIEDLVHRYGHREGDLWQQLIRKYGPFPSDDDDEFLSTPNPTDLSPPPHNNNASSPSSASPTATNTVTATIKQSDTMHHHQSSLSPSRNRRLRRELLRFFYNFDPPLRSKVDAIIDAFKDFENNLWESLENKYGLKSAAMTATENLVDERGELIPDLLDKNKRGKSEDGGSENSSEEDNKLKTGFHDRRLMDLPSRLKRFFFKHDPARLEKADDIASSYEDNEAELFQMMKSLYDHEPEHDTAKIEQEQQNLNFAKRVGLTTRPITTKEDAERWLMSFCEKYARERTKEIPIILKRFEGKESELREAMESVFGTTKPAKGLTYTEKLKLDKQLAEEKAHHEKTKYFRDRLLRFFQAYDKSKLNEVSDFIDKFEDFEDQLFQKLVKKYGPEPATGEKLAEIRRRIIRIYKKYNQKGLEGVDDLIARHPGTEDDLVRLLTKKYGKEPTTFDDDDPESISIEYRRRLIRFFEYYEPIQLKTNLEKLLKTYRGKEAEMMNGLVACYGPEPEVTLTTSNRRSASPSDPDNNNNNDSSNLIGAGAAASLRRSRSRSSVKRFVDQVAIRKDKEDEKDYQRRLSEAIGDAANDDDNYGEDSGEENFDEAESLMMSQHTRKRLLNFFAFYDPPRVRDISQISTIFARREDEMWKLLRTRFGPEPMGENKLSRTALETSRRILRGMIDRFYAHYEPSRIYEVDPLVNQYIGREEECRKMLERRFGPEPQYNILTEDTRKRLILFFRQYDEPQLANVDVIAEAYLGIEDQLFELLTSQYGPEPNSNPDSNPEEFKLRLARFFKEYPDARSTEEEADGMFPGCVTLAQIAKRFDDWEEELFMDLVAKYGEEPENDQAVLEERERREIEERERALLKDRLNQFFDEYDEDQLVNVETLIDSYWTQPDELMNLLCDSYGVDKNDNTPGYAASSLASSPAAPSALSSSSFNNNNNNNNNTDNSNNSHIDHKKNSSETSSTILVSSATLAAVEQDLGKEASFTRPSQFPLPKRILRIYQKYNLNAISALENILQKYEGREDELLERLVEKYGPEPHPKEKLPPVPGRFKTPSDSLVLSPSGLAPAETSHQQQQHHQNPPQDTASAGSAGTSSPASPTSAFGNNSPKNKASKQKRIAPRERAIRILQIFEPSKLRQIDRLCKKFSDHPEDLVEYLEEQYELEPGTLQKQHQPLTEIYSDEFGNFQKDNMQQMMIDAEQSGMEISDLSLLPVRERVLRMYKNYDPARIQLLDIEVKENQHRQAEFLSEVINELGPEPPGNDSELPLRFRVLKFFQKFNPSKLNEVDGLLQKFKGNETRLFQMFLVKYGPEPSDPEPLPAPKYSRHEVRQKLSDIYRKNAPEKLASLDDILDRYQFDYDNLLDQLAVKYKLERDPELMESFRERLEIIYRKKAPEKIAEMDSILEKYHGLEENLFDQLEIKYDLTPEEEEKWKQEYLAEKEKLRIEQEHQQEALRARRNSLNERRNSMGDRLKAMKQRIDEEKAAQGINNNNDDELSEDENL